MRIPFRKKEANVQTYCYRFEFQKRGTIHSGLAKKVKENKGTMESTNPVIVCYVSIGCVYVINILRKF